MKYYSHYHHQYRKISFLLLILTSFRNNFTNSGNFQFEASFPEKMHFSSLNQLFKINNFSHLPSCGATLNAIEIALGRIYSGIMSDEPETILVVDCKNKLSPTHLNDQVQTFLDKQNVRLEAEQILSHFYIGVCYLIF